MNRRVLLSLIVSLSWFSHTVPAQSSVRESIPAYTRERTQEVRDLALATTYDLNTALLHLSSDDSEEVAEGERMILRRIEIKRTHVAFFYMDIVLAYRLFREKLSPEARDIIAAYILETIEPGSFKYGCRFVHANDNWPFNAASCMILGGEAIGRDDLALEGIVRLETYLMISRQLGVASEYNSPTYNALSLYAVEAVADLAQSLRARVVTRVIAERLWSEIALRWHGPSNRFAAPHSRAYFQDTLGVRSAMRYALHPHLPEGVNLGDGGFPGADHHVQSVAENSLIRHFFGPHLAAMAENKPFPYLVQARKFRPFREEGEDAWPGGFFDTMTYLTETYAVGSAQRTFCGGNSTTPFQIHWARQRDNNGDAVWSGTLFTRYRADDFLPETEPRLQNFPEGGYIHPIQCRNTTVILYRPKKHLQTGATKDDSTKVNELCASAIMTFPGEFDRISSGADRRPIEHWPAVCEQPQSVFLEDDDTYLAIHPLSVTDLGRNHGMTLEKRGPFLLLNLYNRQGQGEADWPAEAIEEIRNGFVIEVGNRSEYGSFDRFIETVGQPRLQDTLIDGIRTVNYQRPGREVQIQQRVATQAYLTRSFDGEEYVGPLLRSPFQAATLGSELQVGDALLTSGGGEPKFLTAIPSINCYVVLYPFRWTHPLQLSTTEGQLRSDGFRMGRIFYRPGEQTRLVIDVEWAPRPLRFSKPTGSFQVILNDVDVTDTVRPIDENWLEIPLPGNDRPNAMHASLDVDVHPDLSNLRSKGQGGMQAVVRNTGNAPAHDIIAAPFISGFLRHYGHPARRIETLEPDSAAKLSWGLKGTAEGGTARIAVTAGAANSPKAQATAATTAE